MDGAPTELPSSAHNRRKKARRNAGLFCLPCITVALLLLLGSLLLCNCLLGWGFLLCRLLGGRLLCCFLNGQLFTSFSGFAGALTGRSLLGCDLSASCASGFFLCGGLLRGLLDDSLFLGCLFGHNFFLGC